MMKYKYVRIQGQELAENTMYAKGIFSMCWQLIQNDVMDEEDVDLFKEIDAWFAEELPCAVALGTLQPSLFSGLYKHAG